MRRLPIVWCVSRPSLPRSRKRRCAHRPLAGGKAELGLAPISSVSSTKRATSLRSRSARVNSSAPGELAYGVIPKLEKELVAAEAQDGSGAGNMVQEVVTPDGIAHVVSRWTGIPVDKMLEGERDKLLRMEDELAKSVVGQGDAVQAVSRAVRRARAGLQDPNRPIGSFIFLGPTGVGKTELTKSLARFLFDDETAWSGSTCRNSWRSTRSHA